MHVYFTNIARYALRMHAYVHKYIYIVSEI